jgi:hypothetical protein
MSFNVTRYTLWLIILTLFLCSSSPLLAATFTVNSTLHGTDANGATTTLVEAIQQANAAGGSNIIVLPANTVFTADDTLFTDSTSAGRTMYPAITTTIQIQGNGSTLDATGKNARFFYVSGSGALTLTQINLVGGKAKGGDGGAGNFMGGGGGAGMGGAIFVNGSTASVTLQRCSVRNCSAIGGVGGFFASLSGNGGGGGGMGGAGDSGGGGGGGGPRSAGSGTNGGDSVGGNAGANNGGVGGGGGGGTSGNAGDGGFGGGGGGGYVSGGTGGNAGAGGFGGGGGASFSGGTAGSAGTFGGVGGHYISGGNSKGGSGAGLGGAIFNNQGTVTLENTFLLNNSATGGDGAAGTSGFSGDSTASGAGCGLGGGVFNYDGTVSFKHVTASGNKVATGSTTAAQATGGVLYNYDAAGGSTPAVTLYNSILANSTFTNAAGVDVLNTGSGTISAPSSNVVETSSGTLTGTPADIRPATRIKHNIQRVGWRIPARRQPCV